MSSKAEKVAIKDIMNDIGTENIFESYFFEIWNVSASSLSNKKNRKLNKEIIKKVKKC